MSNCDFDVIIIGAGPTGLGVALPFIECGIARICILKARTVGASFENWPKQMRLITPSFHSNPFRQPDLNTITIDTSPADFIRSEHPSGKEYAAYLRSVVEHYQLPVREGVKVEKITPHGTSFEVETSEKTLTSRFVIWAAGEFFYPLDDDFDGAELYIHNSKVIDWTKLEGDEFAIIGGDESGVDAAIQLLQNGKTVHLLSRGQPWKEDSADPSNALSPYTRDRLRSTLEKFLGRLHLYSDTDIVQVFEISGKYVLIDKDNIPFTLSTRPILATGFLGSLAQIIHHCELKDGHPVFSEEADESILTPGLFYCGPLLEYRGAKFCFIYKFRSRFGVVASEIAKRLDGDPTPLDAYEDNGFLNEDLDCCTDCTCAIPSEAAPPDARARRYVEAIKNFPNMRVTLITGFLGAGKTTFLRRFISDHGTTSRTGVIINDLSQLEVDGELVRMGDLVSEKDGTLVSIRAGSISGERREEFLAALKTMQASGIAHLIIETSGSTEPRVVIGEILASEVGTLHAVATLVDARMLLHDYDSGESLLAHLADTLETITAESVLIEQLRVASVIVITKLDIIREHQLAPLLRSIQAINPNATLVGCAHGHIEPSVILQAPAYPREMKSHGAETRPSDIGSIVIRARSIRSGFSISIESDWASGFSGARASSGSPAAPGNACFGTKLAGRWGLNFSPRGGRTFWKLICGCWPKNRSSFGPNLPACIRSLATAPAS